MCFRVNGTNSVLEYIPRTEMDYGNLLCWATNSVGKQVEPCVFHVIPAGKPDPVSNCTVSNQTHSSFIVSCIPGFDGGLTQLFGLEVINSEHTVINMTSKVPKFQVRKSIYSDSSFV